MSEKRSSTELAPILRSISSIISWSRLGKSGWDPVNGSFFFVIILFLLARRKTIKISIAAALAHSMRGVFLPAAILILVLVTLPYGVGAQSQGEPVVTVTNQYIVNRYGYAVMNETVKYNNSGSSPVQIPTLQMGVPQNISSRLVGNYSLVGEGYSLTTTTTTSPNSTVLLFSVSSQNTLQPKAVSGFSLEAVIGNISLKTNSSTGILVLEYPSLNLQVNTFNALIQMPTSTFISPLP